MIFFSIFAENYLAMKRLLMMFGCLAAVVFSLSGCFKPDGTNDVESDLLLGYWEVVHIKDDDESYYIENGIQSTPDRWEFDSDIIPDDGNEEYMVYHFTRSMLTLIATDDPSSAELIGISLPYNRSGNKLSGAPFEGDYSNYCTIEKLDENELVLYQDDSGVYQDGSIEYHESYKRTTTLRRIKE